MRTGFTFAAIVAACLSPFAAAQMGPVTDHRGMGPGMMDGRAMSHGMTGGPRVGMPGPAALERLNLGEEQRAKVREIQRDVQRKMHALMGSMREVRWQAEDARSGGFDEAAARKNFDAMAAIRKQMFEARLDARKRLDDVLTREQRELLRKPPQPAAPRAASFR